MIRSALKVCGALAALGLLANPALAARTYKIAPIDLGAGFTLTGSIAATGIGPISQADIVNWNIKVVSLQDTLYTPANTRNLSTGLFAQGGQLLVPTSPGGGVDGGAMVFYDQTYYQARPADFTGAFVKGGQALYVDGASSGFLPLNRSNNRNYLVGSEASPGSTVFNLTKKYFGNGVTMSGTVTTDNATGPVALSDWQVLVRQTQSWSFTPRNSSVLDAFNLNSDGRTLTVTPFDADFNNGGLSIGSFGPGGFIGVYLGDFSYDPAGVVGLVTPFVFQTIAAPLDANGNFVVGRYGAPLAAFTATAVPEPQSWILLIAGLGIIGTALRRTPRATA